MALVTLTCNAHSLTSYEQRGNPGQMRPQMNTYQNNRMPSNNGENDGIDQEDNNERLNFEQIYEENVNGVEEFTTTPPKTPPSTKDPKSN